MNKEKKKEEDEGLGNCIIRGCKEKAVVEYPLLPNSPKFCSRHYHSDIIFRYGCER